jgi:hypothetical protein
MKTLHRRPIAATFFTTALLGIGALPAFAGNSADVNNFLDDAQSTDTFQLTVNPYPVISGSQCENDGSFCVGLTSGTLKDMTTGQVSDAINMFCVDFNHDITTTAIYNVLVQGLVTTPSPNGLSPEQLQSMQLQALLGADFGTSLPTSPSESDIEVQHDIWNLDIPTPTGTGTPFVPATDSGQMAAALAELAGGVSFNNSFLFDIIATTDTGTNIPGQAFMPVTQGGFNNNTTPPDAPEPGTLAMLGLGLIGLGSLKLRRSQR